ncbi:hypothetical protein MHU86_22268 [Fragilaria crotonensis]|nr:hypothetical protein MHU86_22268 [Fragilaria crotonensis]
MLSSLIDDIEKYLQWPKEKVISNDRRAKSKTTPNVGSFGLSSIPSLNGGTLAIYVEMTMHMIISTFAVLEPARRFVQLLISCCHHLLDLTISQTQACVDWRNSQPLLTFAERQAGKTDSASVHYLEAFLQDICAASWELLFHSVVLRAIASTNRSKVPAER